jgi:Glycosyltransferase family 17
MVRSIRFRQQRRTIVGMVANGFVGGALMMLAVAAWHRSSKPLDYVSELLSLEVPARQRDSPMLSTAHDGVTRELSRLGYEANISPDTWTEVANSQDASTEDLQNNNAQTDSLSVPTGKYPTGNGVDEGLLSEKPFEFFQQLRNEIDQEDNYARCARYGFQYNVTGTPIAPRRIYLGALIALEPWELFEIIGAETYELFHGMVFVESNRTQNFTPRNLTRQDHGPILANIFGVPHERVVVRLFVNEELPERKPGLTSSIAREHAQRQDIIQGWKEMGMQPEDLGFLADADETFSRDFFRALQLCEGIQLLDYRVGKCRHDVTGVKASVQIFESSPECPTVERTGYRPDVFIGHCIEGIGNATAHPPAPRRAGTMERAPGWGFRGNWGEEEKITTGEYPLYNALDLRKIGGARIIPRSQTGYSHYSGYHFHNFFGTNAGVLRQKYATYGHADMYAKTDINSKRLEDISEDLNLVVRCVKNAPPLKILKKKFHNPVQGGFSVLEPPFPIYFLDPEYRKKRHESLSAMVYDDEKALNLAVENVSVD